MTAPLKTLAVAGAVLFGAAQVAAAADNEAGVPLTPAEAAGAWTVSSNGQDLCTLTMAAAHTVKADPSCGSAIGGAPTGWQATSDGMALTAGGQTLIAFHRWSNSLFVSHRSSGADLQLRRNY